MPITQAQARQLNYKKFTLTDSDFTASRDDNTALSAGVVGEIATCEIGSGGQTSNYLAVILGQQPDSVTGDTQGNEVFVSLGDASAGDLGDTAEWAFAVRDKGEVGSGQAGTITGFITHRGQDNADPRRRKSLNPQEPIARDGKVLQLLVKDETTSDTVQIANSTFQIPALGGQD